VYLIHLVSDHVFFYLSMQMIPLHLSEQDTNPARTGLFNVFNRIMIGCVKFFVDTKYCVSTIPRIYLPIGDLKDAENFWTMT